MDAKEYMIKQMDENPDEWEGVQKIKADKWLMIMESYHQAKSKEEAEERYERAKDSLVNLELIEEVERGTFMQVDGILKTASGKEER